MSFPAYPAYKNSGSDRLGDVPAHWEVVPCRAIVDECVEKNSLGRITEYLSLMANIGIIRYEDKGDIGNKKPDDLSKCKIVKKGDLVINSMNYGIGSYGLSSLDGICSPVYIVLDPRDDVIQERFALRIFEEKEFQAFAQSFGNGILAHRSAIGWDDLKNILVALPPLPEQTLLSNFLDHETARIDALIEEQQRLIELLKEKRQAVISHAVTKGLDPTVPMKDSGVEWLGEVPVHWELTAVKYVVKGMSQGWSPQCDNYPAEDGEWGVLKVGCVNGGMFNPAENKRLPDELEPDAGLVIKQGDLLISRANTRELVGSAAVAVSDYPWLMLCDKLYRLRLNAERVAPEFLALYFGSSAPRSQIELAASGASDSMQNISQSVVMDMSLTLPPLSEQKVILQCLGDTLKISDELVAEVTNQRCLLQERRSALISAAVTGKIDVRGWQPPASTPAPELAVAEAH